MRPHRVVIVPSAAALLACSGLLPPRDVVEITPIPDHLVAAEKDRLAGKYAVAEERVRAAITANPADVDAFRLLGDIDLTRAQQHPKRWKEHLVTARDAYRDAVLRDPEDCASWTRLALTLTVAARNPELAINAAYIDALPLIPGKAACPSPLLAIADLRPSDPAAVEPAQRAAARPDLVAAWAWLDSLDLPWEPGPAPPMAPGVLLVVLEGSPTAVGVDGAVNRTVKAPEWLTLGAVEGDTVRFTDRYLPARKPATGKVPATSCPGTTWGFGSDGLPLGACRPGSWSGGTVYDTARLVRAGSTHYSHDSVQRAAVSSDLVIGDSVVCMGGGMGPLFTDVPTCEVTYDQPIYQTRRLPVDQVVTAFSQEHADRMIAARASEPLLGTNLAQHLSRGDWAIGMPYAAFAYTRSDLTTCSGRGLLQRVVLAGGGMSFTCPLDGVDFVFQELTLTSVVKP